MSAALIEAVATLLERKAGSYSAVVDGVPVRLHIAEGYNERAHAGKVSASATDWPTYPGSYASGVMPRDVARGDEERPATTVHVAADKGPERIAKEIIRRLVEPVKPWRVRCEAQAETLRAHHEASQANRARIAAAVPGGSISPHSQGRVYLPGLPPLDVTADSVRFEHMYCSMEKALRIIEILREVQP